jgi:hypothetical protein
VDYWGTTDYITILTGKFVKNSGPPVPLLAKVGYVLSGNYPGDVPNNPILISLLEVDMDGLTYCTCRTEIVIYNRRLRKIYAQRWDRNITSGVQTQNRFFFPLADAGVVHVNQFLCLAKASMFQVLGTTITGGKVLVTFRAGESQVATRRIHSIQNLDPKIKMIDASVNNSVVVTVCSGPGNMLQQRYIVYTYIDGPLVFVNTTNVVTSPLQVPITMTNPVSSKADQISLEIAQPMLTPVITPQKIYINQAGTTFNIDEATKIQGPMLDYSLQGDPFFVSATKRFVRFKSMNPTPQTVAPNKIVVEGNYMIMVYDNQGIWILRDPSATKVAGATAPTLITSLFTVANQLKTAELVPHPNGQDAVVVIRTYGNGGVSTNYYYNIVLLMKDTTSPSTVTFVMSPECLDHTV